MGHCRLLMAPTVEGLPKPEWFYKKVVLGDFFFQNYRYLLTRTLYHFSWYWSIYSPDRVCTLVESYVHLYDRVHLCDPPGAPLWSTWCAFVIARRPVLSTWLFFCGGEVLLDRLVSCISWCQMTATRPRQPPTAILKTIKTTAARQQVGMDGLGPFHVHDKTYYIITAIDQFDKMPTLW